MSDAGWTERSRPPGRVIDAGLQLLDRQIIDRDGAGAAKVDDVELEIGADGTPVVTAILAGPAALANRFRGRLGVWFAAVHRRLHPDVDPEPVRVPFGVVVSLDNHLELSVTKDEVGLTRTEDWVRHHVVGRLPGARHAPE